MKKALFILAACMMATFEANAQNLTGREIIQKVKDRPMETLVTERWS